MPTLVEMAKEIRKRKPGALPKGLDILASRFAVSEGMDVCGLDDDIAAAILRDAI